MDFIDPLAEQSGPVSPSLDDMALFVEIVRARGFRHAAQSLGIPSSRISCRIARLERSTGVRLLLRTTRRMELTEGGRIYFERCAPLVDGVRLAHEQLAGLAQRPTGVLRASLPEDYATVYLAPMLMDFAREYPGIAFELDLSARRADLISESLDVAIRTGEQPSSGLVARKIATEGHSLYAALGYLEGAGIPGRPGDLAAHACIRLRIGETERTWTLVQSERCEEVPSAGFSV
jgi:DNA-binding transcriptional LysR family regulator